MKNALLILIALTSLQFSAQAATIITESKIEADQTVYVLRTTYNLNISESEQTAWIMTSPPCDRPDDAQSCGRSRPTEPSLYGMLQGSIQVNVHSELINTKTKKVVRKSMYSGSIAPLYQLGGFSNDILDFSGVKMISKGGWFGNYINVSTSELGNGYDLEEPNHYLSLSVETIFTDQLFFGSTVQVTSLGNNRYHFSNLRIYARRDDNPYPIQVGTRVLTSPGRLSNFIGFQTPDGFFHATELAPDMQVGSPGVPNNMIEVVVVGFSQ